MTTRTVLVKLKADIADFNRSLGQAATKAKQTGADLERFSLKNKQDMAQVGQAGLAMGAALAVGVGAAVKTFADFDAAMSGVQAATHASAGAMDQLRAAALEAGARTVFSATEAADAIEQLAKAGVSTADILGGGLDGALDLAAAGGLEVGAAAEIAATALTQFGLAGSQIPHVADLLAAAAGKAQGDVSDMGMALKQAGLVASQTGLSIEETTAGLASFAAAGLLGSDAGTSFKSMLQRLTPQSAEAAGEMDRLGISAYDAQGNFIGLEAFAGNLQDSLAGLTVEQRNSAMATIFGSDAVRAASVLYSEGAAGIAEWTENVNDAGYAQETAAIKLDNLKGDWEAFMGSLETAFIKTGAASDGFARGSVQQATEVINAYSALPPAAQSAVLAVSSITGVAALAAGGFLLLAPRIAETRAALGTLAEQAPKTTAAMTGLAKVAGIAVGIGAAVIAVDQLTAALADAPPGVNALTDSLADFMRTGEVTGELARVIGRDFEDLGEKMDLASKNRGVEFLKSYFGGESQTEIKETRDEIEALDQALAGLVASGNGVEAARFLMDAGVSAEDAAKHFDAYKEAQAGTSAQTKLTAEAQDELEDAVVGATGAVVAQDEALSDLMEKVKGLSDLVLGLRDSSRGYEGALDAATAALKENGQTLDISTEKGRANEAALDAIAASAGEVLSAMVDSGAPISDVTAKFGQQRGALIAAAEGFGMTRAGAEAYADSVLRIPDKKTTAVILTGADAATAQVDRLRQYLASLTNKTITVRVDQVLGTTVQRGNYAGRAIEGRAAGGILPGPPSTTDNMLIAAATGEFVVNARQTSRYRGVLEAINSGTLPARAGGGFLGSRQRQLASSTDLTGRPLGDPNYGADRGYGPDLLGQIRGLTDVSQIQAAVRAWENYNDELEQAARRHELMLTLAQATADVEAAKAATISVEDRARAQERYADAVKAVQEFDLAASRDAQADAAARLVDALEAQADAEREAADAAKDRAEAAEQQAEAQRRLIEDRRGATADAFEDLNRLLDQERDIRARQADLLVRHGEAVAQMQGRQVQAEADYYARRSALGRSFNAEQQQILDARRDALFDWARLDQVSSPAWGNTVQQLVDNAADQLGQFEQWMDELARARGRGVSEEVIAALGLDQGPQALGQLRQFNAATVAEIDALNRSVAQRTSLASQQVAREQQQSFGDLGRQMTDARARYVAELGALTAEYTESQQDLARQLEEMQADILADQAELATELAAIGQEQGRSYSDALAAGVQSGIPGIVAAVDAARAALGALREAQQALTGQPDNSLPGGTGSPFRRPGSRLNPYIRDSGGPLLPGWTYNGTGRAETVVGPAQQLNQGGVTYVLQFNAPVYGMDDFRGQVTGVLDSALGERKSAARGHGSRT